jgi:hypothetical protein
MLAVPLLVSLLKAETTQCKNQPGHLPTLIVMIAVPLLSTKLSNFIFEVLNQLGLAFLQV